MVDPVSIVSLSLQVGQILAPIVKALFKAHNNRDNVHSGLYELHTDLGNVVSITESIHGMFKVSRFVESVHEVENESNVDILGGLARALQSCSREGSKLHVILDDLGIGTRDGRYERTKMQWRMDRRAHDIERLKSNFQGHRSSIQLSFQLLATLRADHDARELKTQIAELHRVMQQSSQHINNQAASPGDEEQTQIIDEMKTIHNTSEILERRATSRLELLTMLSENADGRESEQDSNPPVVADMREMGMESSTLRRVNSNQSVVLNSYDARNITYEAEVNVVGSFSRQISLDERSGIEIQSLSAQEFEDAFARLLADASAEGMGNRKTFSDDLVVRVADLLAAVGRASWAERPRTYLVLRRINEPKLMHDMVLDGYKDIDFPYAETCVPDCIKAAGVQREFLRAQRYVLSERSADLVRGGRHRHLDKSGDAMFVSLSTLGKGGFSVVDRVRLRNKLTTGEYARKRIDRSGAFAKNRKALASFENEVHNLKRLSHHHLVKFVGSYTDKRYVGIIMKPVADGDLHRHLSKETWSKQELTTLRSWFGCLCSALAYLHANHCRHKDLKPHNILIDGDKVLLADFGTALDWTEAESDVTKDAPEAYTRLYVAPEVGARSIRPEVTLIHGRLHCSSRAGRRQMFGR
ncbi:hypothetical protein FB567DRAFT_253124 [Paraphoma chrysanthemicola]|uniref:Protein kinase domain-containing protein n=1 Tax=Paraphoma chrysanthemicola TaxID=798071 RepID=A0A8K0QTJ4_9PLEO|nr:hypothetical protein FB567DRAFT_253124 [Paraphoma chrysanthemicola]